MYIYFLTILYYIELWICVQPYCNCIIRILYTILYYVLVPICVQPYFLYYVVNLKQILRALAAPTQLVLATASCRLLTLTSQWRRSCYHCPPSTVNPPAMPRPHWVHPTDKACQACPSKPFLTNIPIAVRFIYAYNTFSKRHAKPIPVR